MSTAARIEREYREYLLSLKARGMTAAAVKNDPLVYNDAAERTLEYLSRVALRSERNRNCIAATGFDFDMFADDITMHVLRRLDAVFACGAEYVMAFLVSMVNNEVVSICRKWQRMYPTIRNTQKSGPEETERRRVVYQLDDDAWKQIADECDIEGELIRREDEEENYIRVCKALSAGNACSRFEMLSLLATKVLTGDHGRCTKTRALAEAIDRLGLQAVSEMFFEKAACRFGVSREVYFRSFSNDATPSYTSVENLCDKISKASNHCAVKLCRKMGAIRAPARRACR